MLRRNWLKKATKRVVIVHTTNDQSFQGPLMDAYLDGLVLRPATLLGDGTPNGTQLAGEVFLPRETVLFVQLAG